MPDLCPNCGEERTGRYCSRCGQKDQALRQSTVEFVRHGLNEYFGVDSRLWATLRLLLRRPGRLTSEHIEGRRRRYLAPLRLYLSATVLFFFLLSVLDPAATLERKMGGSRDSTATVSVRLGDIEREFAELDEKLAASADSTVEISTNLDDLLRDQDTARRRLVWQRSVLDTYPPDSLIRPVDLADAAALIYPGKEGGFEIDVMDGNAPRSGAYRRMKEARTASERSAAVADLVRNGIEKLPIVMFFMLPMFALVMKVVYLRRDWYYSEHLVFALHNHAVAFLGFSLMAGCIALAGRAPWVSAVNLVLIVALNLYFLVAQKRVYGQGWMKTLVKYGIVFCVYWGIILFFGSILLLVLAASVG